MKLRTVFRLALLPAFALLISCIEIALGGLRDNLHSADLGVVLGSRVDPDGKPSPMLQARLDQAISLYDRHLFRTVIVSGGVGKEGYDEAAVMGRYLETKGVDRGAIVEDHRGLTTYATAFNTARYMKEHHLESVVIVSQYYHLPRCRLAFEQAGIKTVYSSHAAFFSMRDLYAIPREVIGYAWYSLHPRAT